jgi:glycosyltransferase involved in cell wall biosynthesis
LLKNKKIVVVLPAYNAEKTLEQTYTEIPMDIVDDVVLVDDASKDFTVALAHKLGIHHIIKHEKNKGYGGNQKTCYKKALDIGADIVVMIHPDYQYTPRLLPSMAYLIANDVYPVVLGSRILGRGALKGGMPLYKYVANRFLTLFQNYLIGEKLTVAIERSPQKSSVKLIIWLTQTTSFLTIKCCPRFFMPDFLLRKSLVQPNTLKRPPLLISPGALNMGWAS